MSGKIKDRAKKIDSVLRKKYPDAKIKLNFKNPLELLIATILSAQCTDERVNKVTKDLFKKYKNAKDYEKAKPEILEEDIRSTGFYKNKAKSIKLCCADIVLKHGGKVPSTMDELVNLAGVGRKTANVVLGSAFNTPGLVVDTHVSRITRRLGLTKEKDPVKIELDLMKFLPKKDWTQFSHRIISFGREICQAKKPKCQLCPVFDLCSSKDKKETAD